PRSPGGLMTAKAKVKTRAAVKVAAVKAPAQKKEKSVPQEAPAPQQQQQGPPPANLPLPERMTQIEALGKRIAEHVRAAASVATPPGPSAETRQRAVAAFHERLFFLDRALEKVLDDVRLG